jgi:hypothetical protein
MTILSGSEAGMLEADRGQANHAEANDKAVCFCAAFSLSGTIGLDHLSLVVATNLSMT